MWQILAQQAMDIARERAEEARQHALGAQARAMAAEESRRHGIPAPRSRVRAMMAGALRRVAAAFGSAADAACDAARRLDGRAA